MVGVEAQILAMPSLVELGPPYYLNVCADLAVQIEAQSVLIVHSGAGGLAAGLVEACAGRIEQVVFVDAILSHPGRSWCSTANPELVSALKGRLVDGLLPTWDQWFPSGTLAGLIGDHGVRKRFVRELRSAPVAFLDEVAPDSDLDDAVAWSYLRLSIAYEAEAREARRLGRPALRLDLDHLALMREPGSVIAALRNLIRV